MALYWVTIKEVWERRVLIDAPDEQHAIARIYDGWDYTEDAFDFDCFLRDDTTVELAREDTQ